MRTTVDRRVFIGSTVAGVPLLAGTAALCAQSDSTPGHVHLTDGPDPLMRHVARELARLTTDAKARGLRGEHARGAAAHLRTMAVYSRQTGRDGAFMQQLGDLVAQQGREAVLRAQPDRARQKAELLEYGVDLDTLGIDRIPPATDEARGRALDALLANGPANAWDAVASTLTRAADNIDRQTGVVAVRAQAQQPWCEFLTESKNIVELMIALFCAFDAWFGAAIAECGASMFVITMIALAMILSGCW